MWHNKMKSRQYDQKSNQQAVDLTLRLGFPNASELRPPNKLSAAANIIHHDQFSSFDQDHHQGMVNNTNHGLAASSGGRNGEMMLSTTEANYNPHQIVWSKELKTYVLNSNNYGQLHQGKPIGNTTPHNNLPPLQNNNNNNNNNDLYTLLNPTSRVPDDHHEAEASSGSRKKGSRRRRASDVDRRCTNYNCNTNFTPMWRKGPLGPKSLCNACGIRYRKDMMNREAMAAELEDSHS